MRRFTILAASAIAVGGVVLGAWRLWPFSIEAIEPTDCNGWNTGEFFKKITAKEVSGCLEIGADIRARDADGMTPLFWALDARNQDPDVVAVLLTAGADVNEQLSIEGLTATPLLVAAAEQRGASVLRVLLDSGADTAFRGPKGRTALHFAAERGDLEAVSLLLERGAPASAEDDGGETPLKVLGDMFRRSWDHHGLIANAIWTIRALLQHGADAADLADYGWTEVHTIALTGDNPDELAALIDQGLDPTAETSSGWKASHLAALANEDSRIISTLLDFGVNPDSTIGDVKTIELRRQQSESRFRPSPDVRIGDGRTPLHCAAFGNPNPDVIVALIEGGANPNAETTTGWTPLHAAVYANPNRDVVEALLKGGAKADSQLKDSWTMREVSPTNTMPDSVHETNFLLPLEGGNIHLKGLSRPLHVAVKYPQENSAVDVLIRGGADPAARNVNGETPLHHVRTAADAALLTEAGADPNARDEDGDTPLHNAMVSVWRPETVELVSALIDGGADPNSQNDYGSAPLHLAADSVATNPDVVDVLIAAGADPNARNDKGQSPLFSAVDPSISYGRIDRNQKVIVKRLVELGANPNLRDEAGRTALHRALPYSDVSTIEALLDAGADAALADENGVTPWDLAQENQALKGTKAFWRLNEARFN